jgi:3(or 17)beta-hydroxysteroid dehydrogenase
MSGDELKHENPAARELVRKVEGTRRFGGNTKVEEVVLKYGLPFIGTARPKGYRLRRKKECFLNSYYAADEELGSAGNLDILVNNVGLTLSKAIEDTTIEDWRLLMRVNLEGPFIGTKAALPLMKKSAFRTPYGGSIINVSSISGIVGTANLACYTATKGGLRYFSKSAALEFAKAGYRIRVNTIHPGLTEGASANVLFKASVDSGVCADMDEARKMWTSRYPVNRMAQPMDIAAGVLFLASDASNFMTGTELIMDGVLTA